MHIYFITENNICAMLQIEERISSSYNTDYTVEAILTHLDPLSAAFFIKAIPAEPVGWQILYNGRLHDGILLGDREELTSKICGQFLSAI